MNTSRRKRSAMPKVGEGRGGEGGSGQMIKKNNRRKNAQREPEKHGTRQWKRKKWCR
jgi:hypothetical protein